MAELIGALIASVYGGLTAFRPKTPLFYRIVLFAMLTCLIGNIYTVLYGLLWVQGEGGFHVGYLGYSGMFFFLYSSYYGAINSLADGKEREFRGFRLTAGALAFMFFVASVWMMRLFGKALWLHIVVIPMSFSVYFAIKHLVLPDVEMGIIRVMRPYNALIIALCVSMMLRLLSDAGSVLNTASSVCTGVLLAACMPVVRNGVRKWFT